MVSIGATSRARLGYYLDLAREDYQERGGEKPGLWMGGGLGALGLEGEVESDELYNLFDGLSPDGRRALVRVRRVAQADQVAHRSAFDLTVSAPKSVSILWSQALPELREAVEECHRAAVAAAVDYVESEAAYVRRARGGVRFERARVVAAAFEHGVSRSGDPAIHTHVLLLNVGALPDGGTGALHGPSLFHAKMAAGSIYRVELASRLQERGVELEPDRFSFRVKDVPRSLEWEQSKRRREIEGALRPGDGAEEAARAALRTRGEKRETPRAELYARWAEEAWRHGWGREQADRAFRPDRDRRPRQEDELLRAMEKGLARATEKGPDFSRAEFLRHAARESALSGYSAREIRTAAKNYLGTHPKVSDPLRWNRRGAQYRLGEPEARETGIEREGPGRGPSEVRIGRRTVVDVADRLGDHELTSARSVSPSLASRPYSGLMTIYRCYERAKGAARTAAETYDALLTAFVRHAREQAPLDDGIIVARDAEEAARLNRIAQEQRLKDREIDEAFVRAEHAAFHAMDRVRMAVKDLASGRRAYRHGLVEEVQAEGAFVRVRFDDGGRLTLPAPLLGGLSLGYAVPVEHLDRTPTSSRLFAVLDGRVGRALGVEVPKLPRDAVGFLTAQAGRSLSTRLEHELARIDRHLDRDRQTNRPEESRDRGRGFER